MLQRSLFSKIFIGFEETNFDIAQSILVTHVYKVLGTRRCGGGWCGKLMFVICCFRNIGAPPYSFLVPLPFCPCLGPSFAFMQCLLLRTPHPHARKPILYPSPHSKPSFRTSEHELNLALPVRVIWWWHLQVCFTGSKTGGVRRGVFWEPAPDPPTPQ